MAETNLGRITFNLRGEWSGSGDPYLRLDVVTFNGVSYAARVDLPSSNPENDTEWQKISERGSTGTFIRNIEPSTVVDPVEDGIYIPLVDGTYNNAGGLTYDKDVDGVALFTFSDSAWIKNAFPVEAASEIRTWEAKSYSTDEQVIFNDDIYVSNTGTLSTDIPGESAAWEPVLETAKLISRGYSENLYDGTFTANMKFVTDTTDGGIESGGSNDITGFIPVKVGDNIRVSSDSVVHKRLWLYTEPTPGEGYWAAPFSGSASTPVEFIEFKVPDPGTGQEEVWLVTYTRAASFPLGIADNLLVSSEQFSVEKKGIKVPLISSSDVKSMYAPWVAQTDKNSKVLSETNTALGLSEDLISEVTQINVTLHSSGNLNPNSTARSIYFKIENGRKYALMRNGADINRFQYAFTTDEPAPGVPFFGEESDDEAEVLHINSYPEGAEYVVVYLAFAYPDYNIDGMALYAIYSQDLPDYVPPTTKMLFGNFSGLYSYEGDFEPPTVPGGTKIEDLYDIYDSLVVEFPDRVSRRLIGYGGDSSGSEDTNLPIYEYTFKNRKDEKEHDQTGRLRIDESPKICIMSAIHGNEKVSAWGCAEFLDTMLRTHDNIFLNSIKANVLFKVLPIMNPYGFNAANRHNARGIDLNRTFGEPDKEVETYVGEDWIIENLDAYIYIDYHNFAAVEDGLSYYASRSELGKNVYSSVIRVLSDKWAQDYSLYDDNNIFGYIDGPRNPGTTQKFAFESGILNSATLESQRNESSGLTFKELNKVSVENLVNYILAFLSVYPGSD